VRLVYWLVSIGIALAAATLPAAAQPEGSAASLLPACRLYVQEEVRGQQLRFERGVCIGTVETVLLLHRPLRSLYRFCPPSQITLLEAVKTVVTFAGINKELDRPLHELAIEAFQQRWPCTD
jgi:hypothetical protein